MANELYAKLIATSQYILSLCYNVNQCDVFQNLRHNTFQKTLVDLLISFVHAYLQYIYRI